MAATFAADSRVVTRVSPSPNIGERRQTALPHLLILHYTGMPTADAAIAWLCDPKSQVSCHYVVTEDGEVVQLAPESMRAWHAGLSQWAGVTDVNSASIGIEVCNAGHDGGLPAFPAKQISALTALSRDIIRRLAIRPECVLAHSDVAPERKRDPGELFPWAQLARDGVGVWPRTPELRNGDVLGTGATGEPVRLLQAALSDFGYAAPLTSTYDAKTELVVKAFQRHFRQERVDGYADPQTIDLVLNLAKSKAFMVDLASVASHQKLTPSLMNYGQV